MTSSEPSRAEYTQFSSQGESAKDGQRQMLEESSPFVKMKEKRVRRESVKEVSSKDKGKDFFERESTSRDKHKMMSNQKMEQRAFSKGSGTSSIKFDTSNNETPAKIIHESNGSLISKLSEKKFAELNPSNSKTQLNSHLSNSKVEHPSHLKAQINFHYPKFQQPHPSQTKPDFTTALKQNLSIPSLMISNSAPPVSNFDQTLPQCQSLLSSAYYQYMSKMASLKSKNQKKQEQISQLTQRKQHLNRIEAEINARQMHLMTIKNEIQSVADDRHNLQSSYSSLKKQRYSLHQKYKEQASIRKQQYQQEIKQKDSVISSQNQHIQQLLTQITETQRYIMGAASLRADSSVRDALEQYKEVKDKIKTGRYQGNQGVTHLWQVMEVELSKLKDIVG